MGIYGKFKATLDFAATSDAMQEVVGQTFDGAIRILDPHIDSGTFNRATNTKNRTEPTELWAGEARIQAMRWPNVATARQEAISIRTVVFHIPRDSDLDPLLVQEGYRVEVTDGGNAPYFEQGLYVITSSVNSSYAWDRRIECMMDQGTVID